MSFRRLLVAPLRRCVSWMVSCCLLLGGSASFVGAVEPVAVATAAQNQDACGALPTVAEITRALQKLPIFQAEFAEFHNGMLAGTGTLYVNRPRKMRLEYNPPLTSVFVADGHWFIHYDRELGQTSHFPLSDNPAAFLLESEVPLGDYVTEIRCDPQEPNRILVAINDAKGQGMKDLKLVFDRTTLRCREWMGWSQEGEHIHIILQNLVPLDTLDEKLFYNPR